MKFISLIIYQIFFITLISSIREKHFENDLVINDLKPNSNAAPSKKERI